MLCAWQPWWRGPSRGGLACYFLLNVVWLKPRAEAIIRLARLLFSFECCSTTKARWSPQAIYCRLAIFFWMLSLIGVFNPWSYGMYLAIFFWMLLSVKLSTTNSAIWSVYLAIFFWMLKPKKQTAWWKLISEFITCYFLLNVGGYLEKADAKVVVQVSNSLAIFFWMLAKRIRSVYRVYTKCIHLLFSFECWKTSRTNPNLSNIDGLLFSFECCFPGVSREELRKLVFLLFSFECCVAC